MYSIMCEQANKRKRDPAFQPSEKALLVELVEKHFVVVECKKTDAQSVKSKTLEWQKIGEEFNAMSPFMNRDWQVLKNLWENLKRKAKTAITLQNQNQRGTGGGEEKKIKDDPIIMKVICMIRPNVEGVKHLWDSDRLKDTLSVPDQSTEEKYIVFVSTRDDTNEPSTSERKQNETQGLINGDWSGYTPTQLRTPKASVLREQDNHLKIIETSKPSTSQQRFAQSIPITSHEEAIEDSPSLGETSKSTPIKRTPKNVASRRRPLLKKSDGALLAEAKIKTLEASNEFSAEEHQQEEEKLKQEIEKTEQESIKTEILRLQLSKAKEKI